MGKDRMMSKQFVVSHQEFLDITQKENGDYEMICRECGRHIISGLAVDIIEHGDPTADHSWGRGGMPNISADIET